MSSEPTVRPRSPSETEKKEGVLRHILRDKESVNLRTGTVDKETRVCVPYKNTGEEEGFNETRKRKGSHHPTNP